jgi:integration host factor subunit alpha
MNPDRSTHMALTKNDIVEKIYEIGFTKKVATDVVESLLEIMKRTLEDEEDVLISGFGKFCVKEKRPRRGRNPATGEDMELWGRRVVTFRCSGRLREQINGS